jgi:hypothetical protein
MSTCVLSLPVTGNRHAKQAFELQVCQPKKIGPNPAQMKQISLWKKGTLERGFEGRG